MDYLLFVALQYSDIAGGVAFQRLCQRTVIQHPVWHPSCLWIAPSFFLVRSSPVSLSIFDTWCYSQGLGARVGFGIGAFLVVWHMTNDLLALNYVGFAARLGVR